MQLLEKVDGTLIHERLKNTIFYFWRKEPWKKRVYVNIMLGNNEPPWVYELIREYKLYDTFEEAFEGLRKKAEKLGTKAS